MPRKTERQSLQADATLTDPEAAHTECERGDGEQANKEDDTGEDSSESSSDDYEGDWQLRIQVQRTLESADKVLKRG